MLPSFQLCNSSRRVAREEQVGGERAVDLLETGPENIFKLRVDAGVVTTEKEHAADGVEPVALGGQFAGFVNEEVQFGEARLGHDAAPDTGGKSRQSGPVR